MTHISTKRTADIVFCIDASGSMAPCFDALRTHIVKLIDGLHNDRQSQWDLRLDFLAYAAGPSSGATVFDFRSMRKNGPALLSALYETQGATDFFTRELTEFRNALGKVQVAGDEATFIAIDTALHFPWRSISTCHRVLVVLTDEALETGVLLREQMEVLPQIIRKIHDLHVMLFLVAPSSIAFDQLSGADKSEYIVVDQAHSGLVNLDFSLVLEAIGKSVSASLLQGTAASPLDKPLFGQQSWGRTAAYHLGND